MPADLNVVTVIGRLTRDPELARTAGGDAVASLRLAVTGRARGADGAWADKPNYFDVTLWGARAETAAAHLTKGRRIGVSGRLAWREWQADDGARRQAVEIVASDLVFLDAPREPREPGGPAPRPEPVSVAAGTVDDDDIPF